MSSRAPLAGWIVANRRTVVGLLLVVTVGLGAGIPSVDLDTSHEEFVGSTASSEDDDYVERNFETGPENATAALLIVRREYHVVAPRDIEEQLRYQQRLLADGRVAPTLAPDHPPTGIANVVALAAIQNGSVDPQPEPRPSLEAQLRPIEAAQWEDLPQQEQKAVRALNREATGPPGGVYAYVPKYYDHRFDRRAHATVMYVYQDEDLSNAELLRSQTAMRAIAPEEFRGDMGTHFQVYGRGVVNDEIARSTVDSLLLVGPLAALFMLAVLLYVYRDPLDVLLVVGGVGVVQVWTFGIMGWAGIRFNQLFVSVPVFLTGLSIDYGIHAIMRYREERGTADRDRGRVPFPGEPRDSAREPAMAMAIGGVGAAFVLVTLTTATGFAAGVTSPTRPIREIGLVAAVGIVAALVVFGALVPAVKVELDEALEDRGFDRRARPFATGDGRLNRVLARCVHLAERAPWAVVAVAMLSAVGGLALAGGIVGSTAVDTSFDQAQLHVEDTPGWTEGLPEPFRPGDYHTHESLEFFRSNGFVSQRNLVHLLVRGDVTRPDALERVQRGERYAATSDASLRFGSHEFREVELSSDQIGNTRGPLDVMRAVAAENETFAETFGAADADGDGVPDRNLAAVYDALYAADRDAAERVVHRQDGRYRALRVGVYVNGSEPTREVASEMHAAAGRIDRDDGALAATATGQPVIRAGVQRQVFTTVVRGFALTLAVVFAVLVVVYRFRRDSVVIGAVTMLPVVLATAWILGTMAVLGIPFNVLTALIASFTVGIGVDYSIHVSERYVQELERRESANDALRASVFGTGGALLGSAITDGGGFGVLAFAILTPLQQFGAIVAMTIGYAFVASVVVLPCLLVLWTRHVHDRD